MAAGVSAGSEPVSGLALSAAGRRPNSAVLWSLAVRLVNRHGVNRTASVSGLDYYGLKNLAAAAAGKSPSNGPAFVELSAPVVVGKQCQFEWDNGAGPTMRPATGRL